MEKTHRAGETALAAPLMPSKGCSVPGLSGDHSKSLFLLTKEGTLVERRLHQRKWKWVIHGRPQHQNLTSITPALQDESSETSSISLFFTTSFGSVFEYGIPKQLDVYPPCTDSFKGHELRTRTRTKYRNYCELCDYGLLLREGSGKELAWRNCTIMRKGRNVIGGQHWDGLTGQERKVTTENTLFFVSKTGRLMKLMVSARKLKWKDCRNPPDAEVACIVDQELFRKNIVFVIGRNGRLYQYNKVTDLWHEHYHSQHLVLSQFPGTVIRPSLNTLSGSLFMLSKEGGLVEYQWSSLYGWNWVEHGTPNRGVTLVGSPGPSFEGNQLFLIGSDGKVYLRYMDKKAWKWKDRRFPYVGNKLVEAHRHGGFQNEKVDCIDKDSASYLKKDKGNFGGLNFKCDSKVASTSPIPFSEGSVIFELPNGRLAEIQLVEKREWV